MFVECTTTSVWCRSLLSGALLLRRQQLVGLMFNTIREKYGGLHLPAGLALLMAMPREFLLRRVRSFTVHCCDCFGIAVSAAGLPRALPQAAKFSYLCPGSLSGSTRSCSQLPVRGCTCTA